MSNESSAGQTIHMECQTFFPRKNIIVVSFATFFNRAFISKE